MTGTPWDYGMARTYTENFLRRPNLSVGSDQRSDDREHRAMIFRAPGWVSRQLFHCGCALYCKRHTEPMVKLQWFNLCGRTRLQSFSRLLYLGLGSGLKTTASNHKIQTNISIKQDHTVKRNVMIFFKGVKHLLPPGMLFHTENQQMTTIWPQIIFKPHLVSISFFGPSLLYPLSLSITCCQCNGRGSILQTVVISLSFMLSQLISHIFHLSCDSSIMKHCPSGLL